MDADINYQYSASMVHSTHTINLTLAQLPALEGVEQMLPWTDVSLTTFSLRTLLWFTVKLQQYKYKYWNHNSITSVLVAAAVPVYW